MLCLVEPRAFEPVLRKVHVVKVELAHAELTLLGVQSEAGVAEVGSRFYAKFIDVAALRRDHELIVACLEVDLGDEMSVVHVDDQVVDCGHDLA